MDDDGCTFKMVPKEASCCGARASDVWSPHVSDSLLFFAFVLNLFLSLLLLKI
jgi:hypothetical protein